MRNSGVSFKRRALMMASNVFWLPTGLSRDKVLAAYQFKGVASETIALKDLSGNNRHLTKGSETDSSQGTGSHSPTWTTSKGFTFDSVYNGKAGYLDNAELDTLAIRSIVVRYSNLTKNNRGYLINAGGSYGNARIYAATTTCEYGTYSDGSYTGNSYANRLGPGFAYNAWQSAEYVGTIAYTSTYLTTAILGVNFITDKNLYLNGVLTETSKTSVGKTFTDIGSGTTGTTQGRTFSDQHRNDNQINADTFAGKSIIAAVFFNTELSATQHKEVADMMATM